jgi:hypothetical protein
MKSVLFLVFIGAVLGPCGSIAIGHSPSGTTANSPTLGAAQGDPSHPAKRGRAKPSSHQPQGMAALKGTVVSEIRATKAFVNENVVKPGSTDRGLMLLAATGMIVLQLRRKHKSLAQRPIAPYA